MVSLEDNLEVSWQKSTEDSEFGPFQRGTTSYRQ
jgi:hypothetical protein